MEKISAQGKEIFIVGTAHISKESIKLVKETIEKIKPDFVGVELCPSRFRQLLMGKKWSETNLGDIIKSGKVYLFLINLLLSNLQRKLGESVKVKPGSEMLEAINIAKETALMVAERNNSGVYDVLQANLADN